MSVLPLGWLARPRPSRVLQALAAVVGERSSGWRRAEAAAALQPPPRLSRTRPAWPRPRSPGNAPGAWSRRRSSPSRPRTCPSAGSAGSHGSGPPWRPGPAAVARTPPARTGARDPPPGALGKPDLAQAPRPASPCPSSASSSGRSTTRRPTPSSSARASASACGCSRASEGFAEALAHPAGPGLRRRALRPERRRTHGRPHHALLAASARPPSCPACSRRSSTPSCAPSTRARTGFWRVEFESDPVAHDGTARGRDPRAQPLARRPPSPTTSSAPPGSGRTTAGATRTSPPARLRLGAKRNLLAADLTAARPRRSAAPHARLGAPAELAGRRRHGAPAAARAARLAARRGDHSPRQGGFLPAARAARASPTGFEPLPPQGLGLFPPFPGAARAHIPTSGSCCSPTRCAATSRRWLAGCPQRFGIVRARQAPAAADPRLPPCPADFDETHHHQLELWENFLRALRPGEARRDLSRLRRPAGARAAAPGRAADRPHRRLGEQPGQALAGGPLAKPHRGAFPASASSSSARPATPPITGGHRRGPRPGPGRRPRGQDRPARLRRAALPTAGCS